MTASNKLILIILKTWPLKLLTEFIILIIISQPMPLLCRVEKYFKVKGDKMEVEAPAQGAISAASFVKLMELGKSCFDL